MNPYPRGMSSARTDDREYSRILAKIFDHVIDHYWCHLTENGCFRKKSIFLGVPLKIYQERWYTYKPGYSTGRYLVLNNFVPWREVFWRVLGLYPAVNQWSFGGLQENWVPFSAAFIVSFYDFPEGLESVCQAGCPWKGDLHPAPSQVGPSLLQLS